MSAGYLTTSAQESDHDLTLAIPGDVEGVRSRLSNALETLGYKVLSEQPLHAKRSGQGCGRWDCSANALDYRTLLTVSLKQTNDVAVVATFNYEIKSYVPLTNGDRQTLHREAEALAALATERLAISACSACGTQVNDESHFCRRCGAPFLVNLPELEVLRLTRGTRSSYHNIFIGLTALFLAILTALPLFVVQGARIWAPLLWVGIPLGSYGSFLLIQGIWQLHQTLNPRELKNSISKSQATFPGSITRALPPASANASVTEGTTELLSTPSDSSDAEQTRRRDRTTAEIESDQLM